METLAAVFGWLLRASWQASVLVGLVLLTQWIFRKKLSPAWRYALWLLVLARLLMPVSPQSPVSLFNFTRLTSFESLPASFSASSANAPTVAPAPTTSAATAPAAGALGAPRGGTAASQSAAVSQRPPTKTGGWATSTAAIMLRTALPFVWLAGVCWLALRMVWQNARFARRVLRRRQVTDSAALEALEDCRQSMGLRTPLTVIETSEVKSPALYGFIRPRLVLPQGTLAAFSREELYYIFLHELAHVKRSDMAVNWLISGLRALHWFNPILWFGFSRMAADREVAADALALAHTPGAGRQVYGQTIIKLLESFTRPAALPGLVGILEDKSQMKRRIIMIAQFKQMTRWSTAAAALLLALGALTLTDAQSEPTIATPNSPGMTARLVLTGAVGARGDMSADGKYVSHMDLDTGDLVQFEVASGQTRRITNRGSWGETESNYQYQAFSRDGKQLAYNSYANGWVAQLRIRNLDGSGLRTLYSEKGFSVYPLDWSPDGGSILARRTNELTLISTADGSVRVLKRINSGNWFPMKGSSFSPDGRFIAFFSALEGSPPHSDIFLMTADGRNEAVVAGHPAEDRLLGWAPDGKSLVFLSDRTGRWDIWTVHITEGKQQGEPKLLKKGVDGDLMEVVGFAPNGSLYYRTRTVLGRLYNGVVDLETGKVLVPPAPVTTRYTSPPYNLTWSADGTNLAYLSRMGQAGPGHSILTIRSTATGQERFLAPETRLISQFSWAPDGRAVIAIGFTNTGSGIFRIDTETSEMTRLADDEQWPMLCPDGKTLVSRGGEGITKRNLDTGEKSMVANAGGSHMQGLSPDGREVVFRTMKGAIKTVSLNGGEPRELFRLQAKYYFLWWTRDGRYIIVQARGANDTSNTEIWRVPAQGGTPLKLELAVPNITSFALHPDNRRFVYSVTDESKSELWVLENFLPKATLAAR